MKLKLVGTGAITGSRRSASSLIDENVLIDCGNGIVKTLSKQGVEIDGIETVLITHLHADHFLDLPFFVFARSISKPSKTATVYGPKGTEKIVEHICNDYIANIPNAYDKWKKDAKVEFAEFDTLENQEVANGYCVTSYHVDHGLKKPAYGYIVKKGGKAIGFSGDSNYCESIDIIVEKSDVSVLDMCRANKVDGHMSYEEIKDICRKYNKTIVGTHMAGDARKIAKENPISNLIVPEDGDELDI